MWLLTNRKADDLVVIWSLGFFHGFHEGPRVRVTLWGNTAFNPASPALLFCAQQQVGLP